MRRYLIALSLVITALTLNAQTTPQFSTAGFYELPDMGREVFSMNQAWRFIKSDVEGAPYTNNFDDSHWAIVSIPHGLELLPAEASGSGNYQGVAWYRKHFTPEADLEGKKIFLHFEAIMGKSKVYINGQLIKEHFGGYTPIIADITDILNYDQNNVIAVMADNSDDPLYPVGKPQTELDFSYFGGIYRDCWLITHNDVYITNANYENEVAGGGIFVHFGDICQEHADVNLKAHIRNSSTTNSATTVRFDLKDRNDNIVVSATKRIQIRKGDAKYVEASLDVDQPNLWTPDTPYLYNLDITVLANNIVVDGYRQRIGIRSIEFKQEDGLWINGKPYENKLMGTNRHQDFAIIGNAVPNSMQWRDAKKLRDAGMRVIRSHYVIDPAFMDACDELGLFALVETPGWQFWNNDPIFAERTYSDIRNMVRLHRNHASLFFWEPVLNETHYPESFAKKAEEITREEYPYKYSVAACDDGAVGDNYYPLLLRPSGNLRADKTYFIREWGDNEDDWNAQNSDSRVSREWGEVPMLIQAEHYANPNYKNSSDDYIESETTALCYERICRMPRQVVGACFWHSFDHQRGYHTDPFYGGIMDGYRQPKTAYYMFMSQRDQTHYDIIAESGPMIYIAHELTPFSPNDITVYSNCDQVRITLFGDNKKQWTLTKDANHRGMPSPIMVFEDVYQFSEWKFLARTQQQEDAYIVAEGIIDGEVVATHTRYPSGQAYRIQLRLDDENVPLIADGSDVTTIIAEIVDKRGTVKRLNNMEVEFHVVGEATLLTDSTTGTNPSKIEWGSAPMLIQSTPKAGDITVYARLMHEGKNRPLEGVLEFKSIPNNKREVAAQSEVAALGHHIQRSTTLTSNIKSDLERENERLRKEINQYKLKEVEAQQTYFGAGIND